MNYKCKILCSVALEFAAYLDNNTKSNSRNDSKPRTATMTLYEIYIMRTILHKEIVLWRFTSILIRNKYLTCALLYAYTDI